MSVLDWFIVVMLSVAGLSFAVGMVALSCEMLEEVKLQRRHGNRK